MERGACEQQGCSQDSGKCMSWGSHSGGLGGGGGFNRPVNGEACEQGLVSPSPRQKQAREYAYDRGMENLYPGQGQERAENWRSGKQGGPGCLWSELALGVGPGFRENEGQRPLPETKGVRGPIDQRGA